MRSVIYSLLLAGSFILASACGVSETSTPTATIPSGQKTTATPSPTPTQLPHTPSALEKVLAMTPASFAEMPLEFSDFAGTRTFRGYQGDSRIAAGICGRGKSPLRDPGHPQSALDRRWRANRAAQDVLLSLRPRYVVLHRFRTWKWPLLKSYIFQYGRALPGNTGGFKAAGVWI